MSVLVLSSLDLTFSTPSESIIASDLRETHWICDQFDLREVAVGSYTSLALAARPEVTEVLRDRAGRAVVPVLERPVETRATGLGVGYVVGTSGVQALASVGRDSSHDGDK